jgi:hypothetical protein
MDKQSPGKVMPFVCLLCAAAVLALSAQTTGSPTSSTAATSPERADQTPSAGSLCTADKSICVLRVTPNLLITNPLDITVKAADGVDDINWQLDDQTGQTLASGSASYDPRWDGPDTPSPHEMFHMGDLVLVLPKSVQGVLRLSPIRNNPDSKTTTLPGIDIPVRFGTATSIVTIMVPKDYAQYADESGGWFSENPRESHFAPQSPFVVEHLTVVHVDDPIFASAAAAAQKASVISQAPVRIMNFAVRGAKAYVDTTFDGIDGWAGISITTASVEWLIEKDLSQFPNLRHVVFQWPPPVK